MLPIMAKLNVILRSECVNTWKFQLLHEKEFKVMMILSLKDFNHSLDFEDFSILFSNSNDFKVTWWIDHRPFNKNKQFLP